MDKKEIIKALSATSPEDIKSVCMAAEKMLLKNCGNKVYFRGLMEFSNICRCNCYYCGIRKSNRNVDRYEVDVEDVINVAKACAKRKYGSIVIQAGERRSERFIEKIVKCLTLIKKETKSKELPNGLGITLSVGEQSPETYRRFYEAGAHRYLLRIETSNPNLFAKLHPGEQTIKSRIECLRSLRKIGYQTGTGVMIGLPGQTLEDLANDIIFFKNEDIDMIGMGPFIPNKQTPLGDEACLSDEQRVRLSLLMIAATRLSLKNVNIASTTALQALSPDGREKGLSFGANVIMPLMTPQNVRESYLLYPGKPGLQQDSYTLHDELEKNINSIGREIGYNQWGDSLYFKNKNA